MADLSKDMLGSIKEPETPAGPKDDEAIKEEMETKKAAAQAKRDEIEAELGKYEGDLAA
jgi:hypothetical protein